MTAAEYGRWLADTDGVRLTDEQCAAAARILATVTTQREAA